MPATVTDPLVGAVLDGRYRIDGLIAHGGMSTVYAGTDLRLDRAVALKVMARGLADDPAFVRRVGQEARSAARLAHPNVVGVYDHSTDGAMVFLVMELVRGRTLRDLLRTEGRLAPDLAATLMVPVLAALAAAHRAGVVHRDVKPENILLADDESGAAAVKVADFGLARAVASAAATATNSGLGTVAYAAPEQIARGTTDARTDVYSAGIVLYELLTGHPPYQGETPIAVAYQHVHSDVPPPGLLRPEIPAELDTLTLRATRRDPAERPSDAAVFLAELRDARAELDLRSVPIPVPPRADPEPGGGTAMLTVPPPTGRRSRGHRSGRHPRRRVAIALTALVAIGLALLGGDWWFRTGRYGTVPRLTSLTVGQADRAVHRAHLRLKVLPQRLPSETVPAGAVLASAPHAGHRLLRRKEVVVRLSSGPQRYTVPGGLVGQSVDTARGALARLPLATRYPTVYDATAASGLVVSIHPDPGTQLRRGELVTVFVSKGPAPVQVPDQQGHDVGDATKALSAAGLKPAVTMQSDDSVPAGQVITQSPASGAVPPGSTVQLVVSSGPAPISVPSVVGQRLADARKQLLQLGLKVEVSSLFGIKFGKVQTQDPAAGTQVPPGSTVRLFISPF